MVNHQKNKFIKYIIYFILFLISVLFITQAVIFYTNGNSGYVVTIIFYLLLAFIVLSFEKRKFIKINLLIILLLLFSFETYLRVFKRNILSYAERNSSSIFQEYKSICYGAQKNKNGLFINEQNSIFLNQKIEYTYQHSYNEIGLRERPLAEFKKTNNILILGDSFTEGEGTPKDSTIPAMVEYYLNKNDYPYKVINGGVSGSDLFFEYRLLCNLISKLKIKNVILNLNNSDIVDVIVRGGDERFTGTRYKFRTQKWWEFPYSFSYIYRIISVGIFKDDPNNFINETSLNYAYNEIAKKINDFSELCTKNNINFLLVNIPTPIEFKNNSYFFDYLLSNTNLKRETKYIYYKKFMTDKIMAQNNNIWYYYYPIDFHLKPIGYSMIGKALAEDLIYYKYIEK